MAATSRNEATSEASTGVLQQIRGRNGAGTEPVEVVGTPVPEVEGRGRTTGEVRPPGARGLGASLQDASLYRREGFKVNRRPHRLSQRRVFGSAACHLVAVA